MARPGDDAFEWDDFDFSDCSDFEDDLEQEIEAMEEADDGEYDPVGGGTSSAAAGGGKTLKCDVCGKAYARAYWLGQHKAREHGTPTEPTVHGTPQTTEGQGTEGSPGNTSVTKPGKASKAQRKLRVKRPASVFKKEDALREGPQLVKEALEEAADYPPWLLKFGSMTTPGNTAARVASDVVG
ncbi:uncharacterized protein LOC144880966 [Branchiostoma floridae x Branchiostoma japonicum]